MGEVDKKIIEFNESGDPEKDTLEHIDEYGAMMDKLLKEQKVEMRIVFPEGTMYPEIEVNGFEDNAVSYYLLLCAQAAVVSQMVKDGPLDPDRVDDMLDRMIEMVKLEVKEQIKEDPDEQKAE